MFERLLLAIDESEASEVATAFAAAVANRCSASVHVFFVNEYLVGGRGLALRTNDEARDLVTKAVLELRDCGVRAGGSACRASYRDVAARITTTAVEQGAEAIIMGSQRSRSRLSRFLSPKVRERTTRLTALPVLIAPAPLHASVRAALRIDDELRSFVDSDFARAIH
jgi:nucleotide-binding universal stress UspA family protein